MADAGKGRVGVLVMAYGTPASLDDVEPYYTHIRRGRPPSPEQLDDLLARYRAIGGVSPLREITEAQVGALQAALGAGYIVRLGMKHTAPFIEDAVAHLLDDGVSEIVSLVLAPHYAAMSVGQYQDRARAAAGAVPLRAIDSWHTHPRYIDFLGSALRSAIASLPEAARPTAHVLVTAHSLPARIVTQGDPYPAQLQETAAAVAAVGALTRWSVAWQSAGATEERWLGPDVTEAIAALPAAGALGVVVCAAGFVSDHLEVLFDLDVEARQVAQSHGLAFARTEMPNAHPEFIELLRDVVASALVAS